MLQRTQRFLNQSGKFKNLYLDQHNADDNPSPSRLKPLCPTRWLSRGAAVRAVLGNYANVVSALDVASSTFGNSTSGRANLKNSKLGVSFKVSSLFVSFLARRLSTTAFYSMSTCHLSLPRSLHRECREKGSSTCTTRSVRLVTLMSGTKSAPSQALHIAKVSSQRRQVMNGFKDYATLKAVFLPDSLLHPRWFGGHKYIVTGVAGQAGIGILFIWQTVT